MKKLLFLYLAGAVFFVSCENKNKESDAENKIKKKVYATIEFDMKQLQKELLVLLDKKIKQSKDEKRFLYSLSVIKEFIQGKQLDTELILKELVFIENYVKENGYKDFSKEEIKHIKKLVIYLFQKRDLTV